LRLHLIRALSLSCAVCVCPAALLAQQGATRFQGATLEESSKKLGLGAPKSNLSELGYTIAPGIVFAPTGNMETGYSSNPDEFFANAKGSLYGLTNSTAVIGFLKSTGATTLTFRGTLLQYDGDIANSSRWDSGLALDNAYAVGPNTVATFGAYYLRDEISFVPSDNEGAYGQLAYKEPDFETFGRLKFDQIGYLGNVSSAGADPIALLFAQPSQFDVQRVEGVSGFIFGPQARIGVYGELGGANLDYYSQSVENLLDRDAAELWATGGLRFNLHPSLVVDAGWRVNVRQVEDRRVSDPSTNYFDGRVTWTPVANLSFVAEVDRGFVEPVSSIAVAGDKIHYGASVVYQARPDLEFGANLRHDQIEQIGEDLDYHETELSLSVAYQWSEKATVYGLIGNEHVEEQVTGQSYDRLQVGAGTKIRF
jgi:Putative beta-barrel porin 2